MSYRLDVQAFPLVLFTWSETATAEATRAIFEDMLKMSARAKQEGVHTVSIHDARGSSRPTPETRAVMAEMAKNAPDMRTLMDVVVLDSAALRGVLTAISWVAPGVMKRTKTAASLPEAFTLAEAAFKAVGQPVPARPPWAEARKLA